MISAYSSFLGFRYLITRWINLLGMVGVAVGVWALIVVISVFSGFIHDIRANIRGASADVLVRDLPNDTPFSAIEPIIADVDGVAAIAPRFHHDGIYFPYGRRVVQTVRPLTLTPLHFNFVQLIGVDPERERQTTKFTEWLQRDNLLVRVADLEHPFDVPLSQVARHQSSNGSTDATPTRQSPGILLPRKRSLYASLTRGVPIDVLSVRFDHDVNPPKLRTMLRIFAFSGEFETKHRVFDELAAMVHIDELREHLLGADPFGDWDLVNAVAIRVDDDRDLDAVAGRIRTALADQYPDARVQTWEQQNATFLAIVNQERGMMKLILFAVMLVAAFLIYATLHMMVTQKIRDIGILSSMGATRAGIRNIFVIGGAVIAAFGCAFGTLTGWLTASYLNEITAALGIELFPREIYALDEVPCRLEAWWVAQVLIGATAISLFSAYLPARRAARMEPVRALSHF